MAMKATEREEIDEKLSLERRLSFGDQDYYEAILAVRRAGYIMTLMTDVNGAILGAWGIIAVVGSIFAGKNEMYLPAITIGISIVLIIWYLLRRISTSIRDLNATPGAMMTVMVLGLIGCVGSFFLILPCFYIYYAIKAFGKWADYREWFDTVKSGKQFKIEKDEQLISEAFGGDMKKISIAIAMMLISILSIMLAVRFVASSDKNDSSSSKYQNYTHQR